MDALVIILGILVATAVALYCVRLLDRAWPAMTRRRTRQRADTHEEVKLPGRRKGL